MLYKLSNYLSLQDSPFFKNYVIKDEVLGDGSFSTCRWDFKPETNNQYSKLNFFQSRVLAANVRLQNGSWTRNIGYFPFDLNFKVL